MTDRPILFSAPMVRALLGGRKTQTRRVLKPVSASDQWPGTMWPSYIGGVRCGETNADPDVCRFPDEAGGVVSAPTPVLIGDRFWVRERMTRANGEAVGYPADGTWLPNTPWMWQRNTLPSIHMPRWASRLTLTVTDVRVQRLQNINEEDAIAEGIEEVTKDVASRDKSLRFWRRYRDGGWNGYVDNPIGSYASLWTEINGPGSWEVNPWVAAYTCTVHHHNIDMARAA